MSEAETGRGQDVPRAKRARTTRTRRPASRSKPPNTVNPGWFHEAVAAVTLKAIRDAADGRLNVGDVSDDFVARIPGAEDSPEPAVLLSRIYAHMGHRLPLVRRVERRLEGRNLSSGLGSDLLALAAQLYLRNRDLVPHAIAWVQATVEHRRDTGGKPADDTPMPPFHDGIVTPMPGRGTP